MWANQAEALTKIILSPSLQQTHGRVLSERGMLVPKLPGTPFGWTSGGAESAGGATGSSPTLRTQHILQQSPDTCVLSSETQHSRGWGSWRAERGLEGERRRLLGRPPRCRNRH